MTIRYGFQTRTGDAVPSIPTGRNNIRGRSSKQVSEWSRRGGPSWEVTWAPAPAGTYFETGAYAGVDFSASANVTFAGTNNIEYVVVAGGGGGGQTGASYISTGGGGAGGYRSSVPGESSGGGASAESVLTVSDVTYTVTVGGGGAVAVSGSPSVFGPITSTGGGRGGNSPSGQNGAPGGSGGGSSSYAGNYPGVAQGTTGQGRPGGGGPSTPGTPYGGTGGGGATNPGTAYQPGTNTLGGGPGGNGVTTAIAGTPKAYAGGGGGGGRQSDSYGQGGGGSGGGGTGAGFWNTFGYLASSSAGTAGTGGGGGGGTNISNGTFDPQLVGSSGGSGRVVIRWVKP